MNRKDLAGMLEYAADLMEVLGEGEFRARAYRNAARNLEQQEADLAELAARGFKGVPGVGPALAPLLTEIVQTQEFPYLAELEGRVPPGVLELFRVQGLGPKRIRALWENGVGSLEELVLWAEQGKIRALPGFGARSEASLLEAARYALSSMRRVLLPVGLEAARLLLADLENAGLKAELAGSVRRGLETVGNLDLVVVGTPSRCARCWAGSWRRCRERCCWGGSRACLCGSSAPMRPRLAACWCRPPVRGSGWKPWAPFPLRLRPKQRCSRP